MSKPLIYLLALSTTFSLVQADEREEKIQAYINNYEGNYSQDNIARIQADAAAHGVSADEIDKAMGFASGTAANAFNSLGGGAAPAAAQASSAVQQEYYDDSSSSGVSSEKIQDYMGNYNGNFSTANVQKIAADAAIYKVTPADIDKAMGYPPGTTEKEFAKVKDRNPYSAEAIAEDALVAEAQRVFGNSNMGTYMNGLGGFQPEGSKYRGDNPMPLSYAAKLPEMEKNNQAVINAALNLMIAQNKINGYSDEDSSTIKVLRGYAEDPARRGLALQTAASLINSLGKGQATVSETADYGYGAVRGDVSKLNTTAPTFKTAYDPQWDRPSMYDMINSTYGWTAGARNYADPKNRNDELNRKLSDAEITAFQNGNFDSETLKKITDWRGGPPNLDSNNSSAAVAGTVTNTASAGNTTGASIATTSVTPTIKSDFENCVFSLVDDAAAVGNSAITVQVTDEIKAAQAKLTSDCLMAKKSDSSGVVPATVLTDWSYEMGKITNNLSTAYSQKVIKLLAMPYSTNKANPVVRAAIAQTYAQTVDYVNSSLNLYNLSDKYATYSAAIQSGYAKAGQATTVSSAVAKSSAIKDSQKKLEQGLASKIVAAKFPGTKPRVSFPPFKYLSSKKDGWLASNAPMSSSSALASKTENSKTKGLGTDKNSALSSSGKSGNKGLSAAGLKNFTTMNKSISDSANKNADAEAKANEKDKTKNPLFGNSLAGLPPRAGNNGTSASRGASRSVASVEADQEGTNGAQADINIQEDLKKYLRVGQQSKFGYKKDSEQSADDSLFEQVSKAYHRNYNRLNVVPE